MKTIQVKLNKSCLNDIAEIIDIPEYSNIKVKDLLFPYGYFTEFPELQQYLDVKTFNNLKSGEVEAIQFVRLK